MVKWENLSLSFNNKELFKGLNLEVKSGDKLLIKGNSGCGKSTLFKIALGFIKPHTGSVAVNNLALTTQNILKIRQEVFYLDQDVNLPHHSVKNVIEEIALYKGNKSVTINQSLIMDLLKEFNLEKEIYYKNIKDISRGERQRIGLIIGLLLNRPIWLLDEPTSALDLGLKEKVYNILSNKNITLLVTSHDQCWEGLKQYNWGEA